MIFESSNETVKALPCSEVIPKYISDSHIQAEILSEFMTLETLFLCPDTPKFELFLPAWLYSNNTSYENFAITIKAKDDADPELVAKTLIFATFVYPFYNAADYRENDGKLNYASTSLGTSYQDSTGSPHNVFY